MNFTTYGAWPPVTFLTGPTQSFRGQCINKSLFKFIVILLCKTYSTTLRKHPVTSSYTLQLININIYKEKGPSTESLCRSRQKVTAVTWPLVTYFTVVGVDIYPARVMCPWAWQRSKSPWSLALTVTDNQSEGRWAGIYPARAMCPWAWQCSKKTLELSSHRDRQPEWGASGWTLSRQSDVSLGLAMLEKPLELSFHRDRQPERGASGVMRFWACQRSKKPLELSSHRDWQPERGALGWNLPCQGDVSVGLATLEKAPGA